MNIRTLVIMTILAAAHVSAGAQDFFHRWITCPLAADTTQIYFRRSWTSVRRPQSAVLSVAATGSVIIYVNERKVTSVLLPSPQSSSTADNAVAWQFDVTRFLRPDTNTVAVWYAPTAGHRRRMIAVSVSGRRSNGTLFSHVSDDSWLCREAPGWYSSAGEGFDARYYDPSWKSATPDSTGWQLAAPVNDSKPVNIEYAGEFFKGLRKTRIYRPAAVRADSTGTVYTLPRPVKGFTRLTLRGAHKGADIHFGTFTYICSGKTDEQAFPRFTISSGDDVTVSGSNIKKSWIQKLEAIETTSWQNLSF